MRGKHSFRPSRSGGSASTPAYAGQTLTEAGLIGSPFPLPPHMRGKLPDDLEPLPREASTPAYAGQTPYVLISPETSRLYPRICGANGDAAAAAAAEWPLPPHMRGKLALCTLEKDLFASTPAYAGQTWFLYCALMWTSLYPRICGANLC